MAKPRLKRIDTDEGMTIHKLRGGRYEVDIPAANGQRRTRPTFKTEELARSYRDQIAAKKSAGNFRISDDKATFGDALELVRTRPRGTRLTKGSRDGFESAIRTLKIKFGTWKLKELVDAELRPIQDFLSQRLSESESMGRLAYIKTLISQAFKIAVRKHWLAVNPLDQFELVVPFKKGQPRPTLSLAEISALAKAALQKTKQDRLELTWSTRQVLFFFTLLTPMRNEEAAGLCWDSIDMVHRTFKIWRIVREGDDGKYELVDDTKTGQSGVRAAPMPPFLVPIIEQHRQRLIARGMPVEGRVPILVPGQRLGNGFVTTTEITRSHFPVLCAKAGLTLPPGLAFYIMRHTAANLLKSVGMNDDDLMELGGWVDTKTYNAHYRHSTPMYKQALRPEVVAMAETEGFDLTSAEGLVNALGHVLIARWRQEGIAVPAAHKRLRTRSPLEVALLARRGVGVVEEAPALLALSAPIDSVAGPVKTLHPVIKSLKALRDWQRTETIRLRAEGWTLQRICPELGIDRSTAQSYLRHADIPDSRGRLPKGKREEAKQLFFKLRKQHGDDWITFQYSEATGVHSRRLEKWAREAGDPLPHQTYSYKLEKHGKAIRRMVAEEKTYREMAAILNAGISADADKVSFTGIRWYVTKKLGLKTKKWGSGLRADQFDDDIQRLHSESKDAKQIALVLPISHASVCRRIKALGLNTPADRKTNAALARAKNAIQPNSL